MTALAHVILGKTRWEKTGKRGVYDVTEVQKKKNRQFVSADPGGSKNR